MRHEVATIGGMPQVTRILSAIEQGDPRAAEQLLPLVYDELRRLAARRLAQEKPGQTLQATALVHEAYLRLVGTETAHRWDGRGHFFAAAEAMRRILVEQARRKGRGKRGGGLQRGDLGAVPLAMGRGADHRTGPCRTGPAADRPPTSQGAVKSLPWPTASWWQATIGAADKSESGSNKADAEAGRAEVCVHRSRRVRWAVPLGRDVFFRADCRSWRRCGVNGGEAD
jgi:hypothetical protein